jgi:hypothetical protein
MISFHSRVIPASLHNFAMEEILQKSSKTENLYLKKRQFKFSKKLSTDLEESINLELFIET